MSTYYSYCLGFNKDDKIYPLGPFDYKGELHDVSSRSRSFASDLHQRFYHLPESSVSDELSEAFKKKHKDIDDYTCDRLFYLYLDELPIGSYIRKGYFKISQVSAYLSDDGSNPPDFIFTEPINPVVYNGMVASELQFGHPQEIEDDCGNKYIPGSASEYMYFMYVDDGCEEYDAAQLRKVAMMLKDRDIKESDIVVILEIG